MANGRARAMGATDGFVKVLADKTTDKVLGAHIIGPDAGTLIAEIAMAIEFGASRRGHRPHQPRASLAERGGEGSGDGGLGQAAAHLSGARHATGAAHDGAAGTWPCHNAGDAAAPARARATLRNTRRP